MMEDRNKAIDLLNEGAEAGLPMKAIADLLGICGRTLRRWRLDISGQGFSLDRRKGALRQVAHKFTPEERQKVIDTINDPRFADLPPGQIVAILAEEQQYVGSEMTIYRIMREEGLLNHRGRASQPRKPRPVPVLEASGINQVLAWDITLVPGPVKGQHYYLYMVMDVWSRRILGVEVHEQECSLLARDFFDRDAQTGRVFKVREIPRCVAADPTSSERDLLAAASLHPTVVRRNLAAKLFALANPEAWRWL